MKARPLLAAAIALAVSSAASEARADEKQVCVAASEKAQQLRNAGKLADARVELAVCGREVCPKLIRHDCAEWTREVLALSPSVVPAAKDRRGRDVIDVRVSVDGKLVTESLDGKELAVDPGVHTFHFETKDAEPVDEQVVIRPGEKNRIVTITFAMPPDPPPVKVVPVEPPPKAESSPPVAAFVVGGIGIAALGTALFVDLDANGDARELRNTCAPNCEQSQVDDVEQRYVIAGVTAGIGGALLIVGTVLFFVHGSGGGSKSAKPPFLPPIAPLARGGATTLLRF